MNRKTDLRYKALAYHRRLPARLWKYLNKRGIPDALIHRHLLGWDGRRITIPIPNREGRIAFFKLAKDPEDKTDSPKMLATSGMRAELYGWERVLARPSEIIICEGEFDRLVLEAQGLAAVTSTAGAVTFLPEWAEMFHKIPNVYICFDNDAPGQDGAARVASLIPHSRIVYLPPEVGEAGDVTDFFVRLGRSREDFERLLEVARTLPPQEQAVQPVVAPVSSKPATETDVEQLKRLVTIEDFIARYIPLRRSGQNLIGRCPFHEDHNPSLVVYPQTQSFYCFGCQAHGDVLSFLMRVERLTFPEAVEVLRRL